MSVLHVLYGWLIVVFICDIYSGCVWWTIEGLSWYFFSSFISRFQPETPQASVQKSPPPPQRSLFAALQSLIVGALRLLPFRMPTLETSAQRTSLPRTTPIIAWFRSNFPELWFLKAFLVRSVRLTSFKMAVVLFLVASGYVKWLEFYKTSWKRPGIGEEADVGVIIFMAKYFVLPHLLCLLSMHRDQWSCICVHSMTILHHLMWSTLIELITCINFSVSSSGID